VIQRHGLLERTIAENNGGRVFTSNLAVDAETGEVMLTEVTNQYFDNTDPWASAAAGINNKVYKFNYPAHWAYDRMGPAYKNQGALFEATTVNANLNAYFVEGDRVLWGANLGNEAVILRDNFGNLNAYNMSGTNVAFTGFVKVIRSGRKNQQSSSIGTVVSFENPIAGGSLDFSSIPILEASAIEYDDDWLAFCECGLKGTINQWRISYLANGIWRSNRSWAYLADRQQTLTANNHGAAYNPVINLRNDGQYTNFSPFWNYSGGTWTANNTGWQSPEELTIYSADGKELESKNAIDVYNAATYGYAKLVQKAMGSNAQHREIGYDGFEDYDYDDCNIDHFSFRHEAANVVEEASHTGRRSIKVSPGSSLELTKKIKP